MYRTNVYKDRHVAVYQVSNIEPGKEQYILADRGEGRVNISSDEHLGSITK
jgi:hypothetical protein